MPQTKTRVVGSGYTTLTWQGQNIAMLENVMDRGQPAIGGQGGYEVIQPLGAPVPVEVATSRYLDVGTMQFSIKELWDGPAWTQLQGLAQTISGGVPVSIVDIFEAQAAAPPVTVQIIIKPPGSTNWRGWIYNNVVIVGIGDGEQIAKDMMTTQRQINALYLSKTPLSTSGTPST